MKEFLFIKKVLVLSLLAFVFSALQCGNTSNSSETIKPEPSKPTLDELIGEMIIIGIDGTQLSQTPAVKKYLAAGNLGGIILYEKNIAKTNSKTTLKTLCKEIQSQSNKTVFIGIDQEGGTVNRLKTKYGFPKSVTAKYLGELNNLDSSRAYAQTMAKTIKELGINVNFTPCVDLCSNPNNPIIAKYGRCYSDNPQIVATHAGIFSETLFENNILPVLKHFPGHGSSKGDTHLGMADVTEVWTENEIVPYRALIKKDLAQAIMSAHIINAKLDPDTLPSTLSKPILTGMLRNDLGFKGVIFSDDMQMRAISDHYGLENAILMAVNAGIDVLMFSGNIPGTETPTIERVFATFNKLIEEGKISEKRLLESYERIQAVKSKL